MAKLIPSDQLESVLRRLAGPYRLYVPAGSGEEAAFVPWQEGVKPALDGNTYAAAKGIFFPRSEVMFAFAAADGRPRLERPTHPEKPIAVFGLRPCDARAIALLDNVFVRQEPVDELYLARRRGALLLGLACTHPGRSCFCSAVGGSPAGSEGLDVLLLPVSNGWVAEAVTPAGEEYLAGAGLEEASAAGRAESQAVKEVAAGAPGVDTTGLAKTLEGMFEHEFWSQLHEKCLGCAACTFFCPTCHCFDVTDEGRAGEGVRLRSWDSCMFPLFTLHTSGHNPRVSGKERMRQRVMHKFCYYPLRFGPDACVGCGRCIEVCPVNLDIRQVLSKLGGLGT
jgi:ferredoxin